MSIWRKNEEESKAKIIIRESTYFICFFLIGTTLMPLITSIIGLPYTFYNIYTYLIKLRIDAWLLALLPYLIFIIYRLREKAEPESFMARVLLKKEDEHLDDKVKVFVVILVLLAITSALSYLFYPKPMAQSYYGEVNECSCFGIEKRFSPEPQFWGENTQEWSVCFGVMYSCF